MSEFYWRKASSTLLSDIPSAARIVDLKAARIRSTLWPLVKYLIHERPAAILVAMWPLTGIAALAKLVAKFPGRLVVSEHNALSFTPAYRGWSGRIHRLFGAALYRLSDSLVCVSNGVRADILSCTRLAPDHVRVVYNPVRRPHGQTRANPAILKQWQQGEARLISVGSLKAQKDFPTLIHALARLRESKDARLLLIGEGERRAELEALIISLDLVGAVQMPGFVPDPYPYLAHADLFVLSSAWEGLGNVIIEALVAGVPVVSTDCPSGPAEILDHGRYGRLVPVGDPKALAQAITETLNTEVDRHILQRRGNEFSVARAAAQYLDLLIPGSQKTLP